MDNDQNNQHQHKEAKRYRKPLRITGFFLICILIAMAIYATYIYAASPPAIRKPAFQHYHFRMQVIANGQPVNFGQDKFQIPLGQDSCSADLTEHPIHFHDRKDQMVHIHWEGVTGGMVLKNYGWDYIGGVNGALGYRFDNMPLPKKVSTKGTLLPVLSKDAKLYVYTGDETRHKERLPEDFLKKDLEDFFGKLSNIPGGNGETSMLDWLFPKAYAHQGHAKDDELQELNNLIGDVVIFAQKDRPSEKQIKDRFNKLEPLSESICSG